MPNISEFDGKFNLTMTYRSSSDFDNLYVPSVMRWGFNETFDENADFYGANRRKFAAAIISKPDDTSERLKYIAEMKQHVNDVEVYGKLGKPCPETFQDGRPGDCREIVASEYKFFLAFENSFCAEYITEKFFNTLKYTTIPVVLGSGDYSRFVRFQKPVI